MTFASVPSDEELSRLAWPAPKGGRLNQEGAGHGEESLLPLVVQHARTGQVLMLGYVTREALALTLSSGLVTFWSRSRKRLWTKGEGSGNTLRLRALHIDCDADTLLALAEPAGPTCHRMTPTCFDTPSEVAQGGDAAAGTAVPFDEVVPTAARLARLFSTLEKKKGQDLAEDPESYAGRLLAAGLDRCLRKLGEETTECIVAAKSFEASGSSGGSEGARAELTGEAADVLFHLFATLVSAGVSLEEVCEVLAKREGKRRQGATLASKI